MVHAGDSFDVEVEGGYAGASCRVANAEKDRQVAVAAVRRRGNGMAATVSVPSPGVYRVTVAGGGYTPVESLLIAVAD
jgi:hypothetical protein